MLAILAVIAGCIIAYYSGLLQTLLPFTIMGRSAITEMSLTSEELSFDWKIKDFSSLSREAYYSSSFSFANESWYLGIYPNRESGHIGVYLFRKISGPPITLELSLSLKTLHEMKYSEKRSTYVFEKGGYGYGFSDLVSRKELLEREVQLLPSDILTIICTLKLPASIKYARPHELLLQSKILKDFKELYLKQDDSDVLIRVKEQEFPAHKIILKARSPVFASVFRNDLKEKEHSILDIEDCDPSTFSKFLHFIYSGYIPSLSSENDVFRLFTLADKYDVSDLKIECLEFMKENLSVRTFFETITLALLHFETELINLTTDFFVENAQDITRSPKWQAFSIDNPTHSNKLVVMAFDKNSKQ